MRRSTAPVQSVPRLRLGIVAALAGLLLIAGGLVFADWWSCLPESTEAAYVGRDSCIKCHARQHELWQGSFHDKAMDLATPETVLGDFDDATFTHHDVTSRMFRREGRYFINTEGPAGKLADFEIKYVFGVDPLQNYMVEFDRPADMPAHEVARVQVLRISWDTRNKRWFYLAPPDVKDKLAPDDDLHWTGIAQWWNNMCADCHSTNLQKNFDPATKIYHTTFSEIDVSCEACHGPGSVHVQLATARTLFWDRKLGYGLPNLKDKLHNDPEIQTCAKCHARRRIVHEDFRPGANFYDFYANELLQERTYHADGQILDEDYEHGSFLQSKMYHKGIRCSDCHDPHSLRLKHEGNQVCTSCHAHSPGKYDSPAHHHHNPDSKGAQCVACHMPASTYMEVDPRRDHSLRIPRPDLSALLGTPNACTGCHLHVPPQGLLKASEPPLSAERRREFQQYNDWIVAARSDEAVRKELARLDAWALDNTRRWFGEKPDAPEHFAVALAAARRHEPAAEKKLLQLARNRAYPAIARATALVHLAEFDSPQSLAAAAVALEDRDPQVRHAALGRFEVEIEAIASRTAPEEAANQLAPLVEQVWPLVTDDVRLVRAEAGRVLSRLSAEQRGQLLSGPQRELLASTVAEFKDHLLADSDRAGAHNALGAFYETQNDPTAAEAEYRLAIEIEPGNTGARTNLAALLDRLVEQISARARQAAQAQDQKALQAAVAVIENCQTTAASLRREELKLLERDARLAPDNSDVQYRYAMSLYLHEREPEAEATLLTCVKISPQSAAPVVALALLYQKQKRWPEALRFAERAVRLVPRNASYQRMLAEIRDQASANQ